MFYVLKDEKGYYIVHVGEDVCYTEHLNKATTFLTELEANAYKDRWDLWEYHVMFYIK